MSTEEVVGIGVVKKGDSAAMLIMALLHNKPDGDGWAWVRQRAAWVRTVEGDAQ
jgi:hypothetical protein